MMVLTAPSFLTIDTIFVLFPVKKQLVHFLLFGLGALGIDCNDGVVMNPKHSEKKGFLKVSKKQGEKGQDASQYCRICH